MKGAPDVLLFNSELPPREENRMVRLLIAIAALVSVALPAQAFVLVEIAPARFSEESAGILITLNTAQIAVDYSFTLLHPKHNAPKIPLPIIQMNLSWLGPGASQIAFRGTREMDSSLETAGRGRSEWKGFSHIIRISNGAGETKVVSFFNVADLKKFQGLGADNILMIVSAGVASNTKISIREFPISEILAAPPTLLPTPQAPRPTEPPQKSRDSKWKASLK